MFSFGLLKNSTVDSYRPLINYKWYTTIDSNGSRELLDMGTLPKYNAKLYSGRGVKFNGVDQSVNIQNITSQQLRNEDWTVTTYIERGGASYSVWLGWVDISIIEWGVKIWDGTHRDILVSNAGGVFTLVKKGTIYSLFHEGVFIGSQDCSPIAQNNGVWIGNRPDVSYSSVIVGNFTFISKALTISQIAYQYNNPEKFLYREDNILKSKILNQSEIDNVVAWFPMCETDGYVRDMVNYSESENVVGVNTFTDWGNDTVGTVTDNLDGSYTIDVTTAGTSATVPRLDFSQLVQSKYIGETWVYSLDVVVNSGTLAQVATYDGAISTMNKVGNKYILVSTASTDRTNSNFYFDGRNTFSITISNITVKKLTGIYQINNYTDSCRDLAKNLSTGLQTCFFKRDVLGVPYASSFNELSFDGVGYADTGWIPNSGTYFEIEIVMFFTSELTDQELGSSGFRVIRRSSDGTLLVYGDENRVFTGTYTRDGFTHLVVRFNTDGTMSGFSNNNVMSSGAVTNVVDDTSFLIGKRNSYDSSYITLPIKLFKVHTTPQDPAKLYADAVKKGLLS